MEKGYGWQMEGIGKDLVRKEFELGSPSSAEVLVEVAGCGVCHTDLGYYFEGVRPNHPLPLILGHEISGRVVQAGVGAEKWLEKSVIIPAVIPCGIGWHWEKNAKISLQDYTGRSFFGPCP